MDRILKSVDRLFGFILFLATASMLIVGVAQVFWRYVMHDALTWSEELIRYLYVWATLLGIGLGIRRNLFTTVTVFSDWLNRKSKTASNILWAIMIVGQLFFFIVLTYYGVLLSMNSIGQLSPTMRLSMGIVYIALPFGGLLGIIYSLLLVIEKIKGVQE